MKAAPIRQFPSQEIHTPHFNVTDSSMGCNINAQTNFKNEYVQAVNT